jgi:saccharopine dehydrogenase (NAD+, L-lysine forming)
MNEIVGIRREDKNEWERRVPIIPEHIRALKSKHALDFYVQPFERRAFLDDEFREAGAQITEDLSQAKVIFAVKEIPTRLIIPQKTYLFFSHTVKGQSYNMPLLQRMLETNSTLIDYERIADGDGRRLVFFGRFAGLAGMIDALYGLGQRLRWHGYITPFIEVRPSYEYDDLDDAKNKLQELRRFIEKQGLPKEHAPYIFGFAGYGNVSQGAQEILDILPVKTIRPDQMAEIMQTKDHKTLYKVVFKENDLVTPNESSFDLQEYYHHPEKYHSIFENHLPYLSVLINAIYWDNRYPRLLTKKWLQENHNNLRLDLVYDISCDINGAIEITDRITVPNNPAYVYNPADETVRDGFTGKGVVNMAVDNLPTELPRDASVSFSQSLLPFIPQIMTADYSASFKKLALPPEIKKAVITHQGDLTPEYKYLEEFLKNFTQEQKLPNEIGLL